MNFAARTDYMPAWSKDAISDADLTALRMYIGGLQLDPPDGELVISCLPCTPLVA